MIIQGLVFYLFSILAVGSSILVITSRNPVHSVLWLVLTFFNVAGLFVLQGAEFLAMLLVIVYVGAVAVLFMFAVMMLDINALGLRERTAPYLSLGVLIGLILLVELALVIAMWQVAPNVTGALQSPMPDPGQIENTKALGALIYTDYVYLFQASGLVLLVAMIGAILLTHRKRTGVKRQVIAEQIDRRNTISLKKVPTREGI